MRYEVFGATGKFGAMLEVGAAYSHNAAFRLIESEINSTVYPRFIVVEMLKKNSAPIGVMCGMVKNGFWTERRSSYTYGGTLPGKDEILTGNYLRDMNKID